AAQRQRGGVAAVVADQAAPRAVHGHARIAVRAGGDPAAVVAQQRRRVAAPVEEQQRLAAGLEVPLHAVEQRRTEAVLERLVAHVDHADARRRAAVHALQQLQVPVASGGGVVAALQRRRGAAQQRGDAERTRADQGEVARRVAQAFLLLVGSV